MALLGVWTVVLCGAGIMVPWGVCTMVLLGLWTMAPEGSMDNGTVGSVDNGAMHIRGSMDNGIWTVTLWAGVPCEEWTITPWGVWSRPFGFELVRWVHIFADFGL